MNPTRWESSWPHRWRFIDSWPPWGISCEPSFEDGPFSAAELRFLPGKLYDRVICAFAGDLPETHRQYSGTALAALRILLVDDAVINREIIVMMLYYLGQDITLAADGTSALVLGGQQQFDQVLMDLRIPDMDGTVWHASASGARIRRTVTATV